MHPLEMHTLTHTWNRYSDHLSKMANEMIISSQFADVTLVTDDKQLIRAHQNILSASCSPVVSGESIFKCLDCERIFNDEQALYHLINKKFTQQITLTSHIHSIHEGVKYP